MTTPAPRRDWPHTLAFFLFALLFSYHFAFLRAQETFVYAPASPQALAQGTGLTPYQYRVLMPAVAAWLTGPTGLPLDALFRLLEFLVTLALFYAVRAFLLLFAPDARLATLFTLLLAYVLPFNFTYTFFYPYDLPALLFTTLGLIALYRRQWLAFYALFVLATFNRETSYFLAFVFLAVSAGREAPGTIAKHLMAQAGVWLAIKGALFLLFRHNPAQGMGVFEFQFVRNLGMLAQPGTWLLLARNWGMMWVFLLLWHKQIHSPFLRRALLAGLAQLAVLFVVGVIEELRIYGELIPLVLAGIMEAVTGRMSDEWRVERRDR